MWRKEDSTSQQPPESSPASTSSANTGKSGTGSPVTPGVSSKAAACVSQGIRIKGELSGSEDLFIDGTVDGKINLSNSVLTVGPNAIVKADITARELVLRGRAEGKFEATERIQIWGSARVEAELKSQRLSIEDGAELRGKVETGRAGAPALSGAGSGANKKQGTAKGKDENPVEAPTASDVAKAGAD
jgi:cytoskeletal protein CcmA (bactofilin family)